MNLLCFLGVVSFSEESSTRKNNMAAMVGGLLVCLFSQTEVIGNGGGVIFCCYL